MSEIAIIIVHFRGVEDIVRCLESLATTETPSFVRHVIVVDNEGSAELKAQLAGSSEFDGRLPVVQLLTPGKNLGFAGGNNFGWEYIRRHLPQVEFVALLNQDTKVGRDWDFELLRFLQREPSAAAAQAKILLMDQPTKLNTRGNKSHYLGFGFVDGYLEEDDPSWTDPRPIGFASGCAVMLRRRVIEEIGLFDEEFFMYSEDLDLGWKIRQAGFENYAVPTSVVWHDYSPTAPEKAYFYLERNRWILLLTHYSWWTLFLLTPALIFMECGQWMFAASRGLVWIRVRIYVDLLRFRRWVHISTRRRKLRSFGSVSQGAFVARMTSSLENSVIQSRVIRWVASPVLNVYWKLPLAIVR